MSSSRVCCRAFTSAIAYRQVYSASSNCFHGRTVLHFTRSELQHALPLCVSTRYFSGTGTGFQQSEEILAAEATHVESKGISASSMNPLKWVKNFYANKGAELRLSKYLYECCVEKVDYDAFYKAFNMPDTFHSWFMVLQLHVWFLLVRLKQEGSRGKHVYQNIVKLMWFDVEERMKLLQVHDATVRKNSLRELVEEFHGCIVALDEGILSHDHVLAAALWRNFVHDKRRTNATALGDLVGYVREQMSCLDDAEFQELLKGGQLEWVKFGLPVQDPPPFIDNIG